MGVVTTKEAKVLVSKIKYANYTEAVKIVKELEIKKPKRIEYTWDIKKHFI